MYSLAEPKPVTIACYSISPTKILLEGTGILKLAPGCSIKAKDVIIPATTSETGMSQFLFESELLLILTRLSPLYEKHGHLLDQRRMFEEVGNRIDPRFSTFEANSKTLDELEQQ